MAIRRLLIQTASASDLAARTEAFIKRGMQIATDPEKPRAFESKPNNVLSTMPGNSHARIEYLLEARRGTSRAIRGLLEAIVESWSGKKRTSDASKESGRV